MRDREMRAAIAARVAHTHASIEHLLVEEVEVRDTGRRMDLMLVADDLTAIELKSDSDSLRRLAEQAQAFSMIADRAVLAVGARHLTRAVEHVPAWWAVWQITPSEAGPHLRVLRRGTRNPCVDARSVAGLLLRDELVLELSWHGVRGLSHLGVTELRDAVVDLVPAKELGPDVREHLRRRELWRRHALSQYRPAYEVPARPTPYALAAS